MSRRYSIAQRTPSLNSLVAGLACAITLTLTVGPALAQSADLERVEIKGRVIEAPARYDVLAACPDIAARLPGALDRAWHVHGRYGEVQVQFVMDQGVPEAVQAKGISNLVAREVRNAVSRLDCGPQTVAGPQVYRFVVDFIDPYQPRSTQTAAASSGVPRIALVSR
jgi:hypothetical protein